jgi:hypothetical protein
MLLNPWRQLERHGCDVRIVYSPIGRPSIPLEKLLRAMLLQGFYSIRSERLLMERLEYDLLFAGSSVRLRRRSPGPFGVLEEPRPALEGEIALSSSRRRRPR